LTPSLPGEAQRTMRTPPRSRKRRKQEQARGQRWDHRLATAATVLTVGLLALAVYALDPSKPTGWSWQVLMLCALVAALAWRALVGPALSAVEGQPEPGERTEGRPVLRSSLLVWVLLLGAATAPNLQSLRVGFLADDYGLVGSAKSGAGPLDAMRLVPLQVFHRPVSALLWWLGGHLWGWSPLGFHLLSVLLHAGNTALLYLLARRYIGSIYGGAMAALLFAVHPYHVEATTWVAAQPDLLCLLFCLLSLWGLEGYIEGPTLLRRGLALAGAVAAYGLALYSKETAMAFPGVVFLRLVLVPNRRLLRAAGVTAGFGLVLAIYLTVRWLVLGKDWLASYRPALDFWNTVFPSMPLRIMAGFFFPVHQGLFDSLAQPSLAAALIIAMAVGLLWWIRSLEFVPWQRIALCLGYLLVLCVPAWMLSYTVGVSMANSRYAYLPAVGLCLLFGEVQARRRDGWRQRALVGGVTIVVAAALSLWYFVPWRQAAQLRDDVLAAGVRVVEGLPESPPPTALLVRGIPWFRQGVPVCVNAYSIALSPLLARPIAIQEIPQVSSSLDAISASDLRPGEYLLSWDQGTRSMVIERAGAYAASSAPPEARP